jgi:hypothetical protein
MGIAIGISGFVAAILNLKTHSNSAVSNLVSVGRRSTKVKGWPLKIQIQVTHVLDFIQIRFPGRSLDLWVECCFMGRQHILHSKFRPRKHRCSHEKLLLGGTETEISLG